MKDELKRAIHHRGRTTEDSTKKTKTTERRGAKRAVKRDVSTQLMFTNTERSAVPAILAGPRSIEPHKKRRPR